MDKHSLLQLVDQQEAHLFSLACQVFDHPEIGMQEEFASELFCRELEALGFQVERGIAGLKTAFRATLFQGEGGLNIGLLGEYDALSGLGHGCGHHMQTPAAIGAALALREALAGSDLPYTLTIYGTPAEETIGGKILMAEQGCFRELDIALATHATGGPAFVGGTSMAIRSYAVTFQGVSSHASTNPWDGRSAGDAMLLSFQGIEFFREHVRDGTRMHYSISQRIVPSNVVPDTAQAGFVLRSRDNAYLSTLEPRFRDIIQGACLMTGTTAQIQPKPVFLARIPNNTLARIALANYELLGIPHNEPICKDSNGSTDFGNVSALVPGALLYVPYVSCGGHSAQWVEAGKSPQAQSCLLLSAKLLALTLWDLLQDPSLAQQAKAEFHARQNSIE